MNFKMKNCRLCGNTFQQTNREQNYCSVVCKIKDNIIIDDNDCWNFTGYRTKFGYGQITYHRRCELVHRFMCESVYGPAPMDKPFTLHSCDNPPCCNPDHLRWGSPKENTNDMMERNRHRCGNSKGEQIGTSKLTEVQVIEIINKLKNYKYGDCTKLAKEYKIGVDVISAIYHNKTWKHLPR